MNIKDSAVIITGGASGMGEATVLRLAKLGAKIAIFDRDYDKALRVAQKTGSLALNCDVTDEQSVLNALDEAQKKHGTARVCINCAGVIQSKRMVNEQEPLPLKEFEHIVRINLTGTFNVMRLSAFAMSKIPAGEDKCRGVIINTASIAAFEGQIGQVAYSATKNGILGMTLPAARELARFGIRVMAIARGLVDTPLLASLSEKVKTKLTESVPFPNRLVHPDEFAQLAQHIIENDMLNGTVIRLDGALRMGS